MNTDDDLLHQLTQRVIGCAFDVSNSLGVGFPEKVYENALAHELRKIGLIPAQQHAIAVNYDGVVVGEYVAGLLIENNIARRIENSKASSANKCVGTPTKMPLPTKA